MVIYGVALLSFCMLVGVFAGDLLGKLIGVQANVGGGGVAAVVASFALIPVIARFRPGHGHSAGRKLRGNCTQRCCRPDLVPYGAMTATFYTGVGGLLAPSLLFLFVRMLF